MKKKDKYEVLLAPLLRCIEDMGVSKVADAAGVSRQTIYNLKNAQVDDIHLMIFLRLCTACKIDPRRLIVECKSLPSVTPEPDGSIPSAG